MGSFKATALRWVTREECIGEEPVGSDLAERVQLEREDVFIRKLVDPKLPSPEEIKIHRDVLLVS